MPGWELAPGWVSTRVILLLIGKERESNVAWIGAGSWLGEYKSISFLSLVEKERQTWPGWGLTPGWVSTRVILALIVGEGEANVAWMGASSQLGEYKSNPFFSLVKKERQTWPGWELAPDWVSTRVILLLIC